ncbi:early bolting in short days [Senna tora]|uniref:Early bolting in short days n=1 Tax=Senna tora TaxID=362788 RepID=A0A834X0L3_9FABA|nr:early bolting in short days [Senna tora]
MCGASVLITPFITSHKPRTIPNGQRQEAPNQPRRYCECEMPYNPDDLMVQSEGCKDW